jgi:AraC-like DNA-binding protein
VTGFLNTIILLGALQGFIVSILLFRRKTNKQSDSLLAFLLLLMSLASLNLYCFNTGFMDKNLVTRIISWVVPLVIVMPMGPLIYFYIQSMLDPSFRLTRRHRLQFWLGLIDIVPELTAIIFIAGAYMHIIFPNPQPWGLFIDRYNMYADIPRWISLTLYTLLSYRYLKKVSGNGGEKSAKHKWLQQFIAVFLVFQLIWFIYLIPYVLPAYSDKLLKWVDWYPIYIPLAIMIYWLGIKGFVLSVSADSEKKKKARSQELPGAIVQQATDLLEKAMEQDRLFLNPALNLELLAAHTGIPAKTISAVLNQHHHRSFNEWLNAYRLQEFKQKIREGYLQQLTISAIALECGFNSQATFQRIFKQSLGMTPSEYLKTARQER